jgi:hypothetical protein
MILSATGKPLTKRTRVKTPRPATPGAMMNAIVEFAKAQGTFDRVSAGFPGVVRRGVIVTAPNLDGNWRDVKLAEVLSKKLGKPVRVANDADMQGFGVIAGHGVELVITLGTGFGAGLFVDGKLVPNLEIAHHPFQKGKTYEELLGDAAPGANIQLRSPVSRWRQRHAGHSETTPQRQTRLQRRRSPRRHRPLARLNTKKFRAGDAGRGPPTA